ncbi:MAG TPA: TonB-dependent receptor plug domain-containing protein [Steroidobacteraceae bacterium]|nr:TonB-dependent receptor plug domain-containing protein [Steroidobacteraceae bacterium]
MYNSTPYDRSRAGWLVLELLFGACLTLAASVAAAEDAPAVSAPEAAPVEEIIVTGSAIPVAPDSLAVPVTIINADAIAAAGVNTNVLDILRKQIPAFAGRSNAGNSNAANNNQNTAGGSSIQLRNLDTLILVNGRRLAVSSISGVNGKVFVNVAEIPPAAIERIEVLTDGASAIYGSDAIGGVVNIILKSDLKGGQVSVRGAGADGGYSEKSVDATYGFSLLDHTNVTLSATYNKSTPLYQYQRPFSTPFYSTSANVPGAIGNYFLNPGITAPLPGAAASVAADTQYTNAGAAVATAPGTGVGGTYDLSRFGTLLLQQQQKAVALSFNSELSADRAVELFGDLEYAQNDSYTRFAPQTSTVTALAGSFYNPLTVDTKVVFASTLSPKTYSNQEVSKRGTMGVKGKINVFGGNWNWELGYTHSENTLNQAINNVIFGPNLSLAVAGGFDATGAVTPGGAFSMVHSGFSPTGAMVLQPALNPFAIAAGVTPGALSNVLTRELINGNSKLDSADAKITGTIGSLPAGRPGFALGAAWRREAISGAPEPNGWVHVDGTLASAAQSLYTGGLSADPFSASRTITSEYLELRVPLAGKDWHVAGFYSFDFIGAVRNERYSDAGISTVPKLGFRWQPIGHQVTVRGNVAKSFTAPSLYAIAGPLNIRQGGAAIITNAFPTAIAGTTQVEDGNNPNLKPAKSDSMSFGFVLKPDAVPGLAVDVEYSSVKETGQPAGIGFNNILLDVNDHGAASIFSNNIATNAFPGQPGAVAFANPGDVLAYVTNPANVVGGNYPNLYMIDRFTNLGQTKVRSLNFNADYDTPTAGEGNLSISTQVAYLLSFQYQALPGQPIYDFAGTTTQGGGAQGTLPRWRAYTTASWSKGHWEAGLANTFITSVQDIGTGGLSYDINFQKPGQTTFFAGQVAAFSAWDARLSFHSADGGSTDKGVTVTAGINNLFDEMPPVSTNINPAAGAATGATAWRTENNTDVSTYGAIGRLVYLSASFRL